MICKNCNSHNPDTAIFCNHCGERLINLCPSCKEQLPQGAMFCHKCGTRITQNVSTGFSKIVIGAEKEKKALGGDYHATNEAKPTVSLRKVFGIFLICCSVLLAILILVMGEGWSKIFSTGAFVPAYWGDQLLKKKD